MKELKKKEKIKLPMVLSFKKLKFKDFIQIILTIKVKMKGIITNSKIKKTKLSININNKFKKITMMIMHMKIIEWRIRVWNKKKVYNTRIIMNGRVKNRLNTQNLFNKETKMMEKWKVLVTTQEYLDLIFRIPITWYVIYALIKTCIKIN